MAELPVWQPAGEVPAPEPRGDGSGRVLAIVASEQASSEGWAPAAAAVLAHRWASEGNRIALVDAGLDLPSLHDALGLKNREGLTDAALHGASLERVSQSVADGLFLFVCSGSPVADGAAVVQSPRWYRITDGMLEAGVTLLVYLREGDAAATAFLSAAADVLVLAGPDDELAGISADVVPLVRAVTGGSDAVDALAALSAGAAAAPDDPSTYASDAADMGGFGPGGGDMPAWAMAPVPADPDGRSPATSDEEHGDPLVVVDQGDAPSDTAVPMAPHEVHDSGEAEDAPPFNDAGATDVDVSAATVSVAPAKGSGGGITTLLFVLLVIAVATALGWMLSSGAG